MTVSVDEHADTFFRRPGAWLVEQDRDVVELHVVSDPGVFLLLRLTCLLLFIQQQTGRNMNGVGVIAGNHVVQALNKALTVSLGICHGLIDVNVHHDLVVGLADILSPCPSVVIVDRLRVVCAHVFAVHHRVADRH